MLTTLGQLVDGDEFTIPDKPWEGLCTCDGHSLAVSGSSYYVNGNGQFRVAGDRLVVDKQEKV